MERQPHCALSLNMCSPSSGLRAKSRNPIPSRCGDGCHWRVSRGGQVVVAAAAAACEMVGDRCLPHIYWHVEHDAAGRHRVSGHVL